MKILLTGGGTGGDITPLLAVAHELKRSSPDCYIIYIGERKGKFAHITDNNTDLDEIRTISAGKFRRYNGESFLTRLTDVKSLLLNIRDLFLFTIGLMQSIWLLGRLRPDAIFLKGGFVGVPIGLAASLWRIPFITHDSDAVPGLANRIVARWARLHATGMPAKYYPYKPEKTAYVGVLVGPDYQPVDEYILNGYRQELALPPEALILFVTGGSHGSRRLNQAITAIVPDLLEKYSKLIVIHQVGKGNENSYGTFKHDRLKVMPFVQGMHRYSGAADVIVSRAGANTLAEFGIQGKACIVVPNPLLTGGHQLKNAEYFVGKGAIISISEKSFDIGTSDLRSSITELLENGSLRQQLADKLQSATIHDAATNLAEVLLNLHKK